MNRSSSVVSNVHEPIDRLSDQCSRFTTAILVRDASDLTSTPFHSYSKVVLKYRSTTDEHFNADIDVLVHDASPP